MRKQRETHRVPEDKKESYLSVSRLSEKRALAREYPQWTKNNVILETNFHCG